MAPVYREFFSGIRHQLGPPTTMGTWCPSPEVGETSSLISPPGAGMYVRSYFGTLNLGDCIHPGHWARRWFGGAAGARPKNGSRCSMPWDYSPAAWRASTRNLGLGGIGPFWYMRSASRSSSTSRHCRGARSRNPARGNWCRLSWPKNRFVPSYSPAAYICCKLMLTRVPFFHPFVHPGLRHHADPNLDPCRPRPGPLCR